MTKRVFVLIAGLVTTLLGLVVVASPASATYTAADCPKGTAYVLLGNASTTPSTPLVTGTTLLVGGKISVTVLSTTTATVTAIDPDFRIFSVRMIGTKSSNTSARNVNAFSFMPGVVSTSTLSITTSSGFNRIKGIGICYGGNTGYAKKDITGGCWLKNTSVCPGGAVSASVAGFNGGEQIKVYVRLASQSPLGTLVQTTNVGSGGGTSISFPAPAAPGSYKVLVVGQASGKYYEAPFTVKSDCSSRKGSVSSSAGGASSGTFSSISPRGKAAVLLPGLGLVVFGVSKRRQRLRDRAAE